MEDSNYSKYKNSKIYKIVSYSGEKLCIGSTYQKLSMRMCGLRNLYKKGSARSTSIKKMFDLYGPSACKIILVENFECDSKEKLNARERFHIDNFEDVEKLINEEKPKLHLSDTASVKKYHKNYYLKNKEAIQAKTKKYKQDCKAKKQLVKENNKENNKGNNADLISLLKALEQKLASMSN